LYIIARPDSLRYTSGREGSAAFQEWELIRLFGYQSSDTLKLVKIGDKKGVIVGKGAFLKSVVLPDHHIVCVWEQDNKIKFKKT